MRNCLGSIFKQSFKTVAKSFLVTTAVFKKEKNHKVFRVHFLCPHFPKDMAKVIILKTDASVHVLIGYLSQQLNICMASDNLQRTFACYNLISSY